MVICDNVLYDFHSYYNLGVIKAKIGKFVPKCSSGSRSGNPMVPATIIVGLVVLTKVSISAIAALRVIAMNQA